MYLQDRGDKIFTRLTIISLFLKTDVQLVDSLHSNEGQLKVYHHNSWKNVCRKNWTLNEANVVCHKLGYTKALYFNGSSINRFNTSDGRNHSSITDKYLQMKPKCTGKASLLKCIHKKVVARRCDEGAVEVRCFGREGGTILL